MGNSAATCLIGSCFTPSRTSIQRWSEITDDVLVELNGAFVAGYKVSGINSYYASDEERNRTKISLEALVRSLPERSMRMQARFEIIEGTGDLIARHIHAQRNPSSVLQM